MENEKTVLDELIYLSHLAYSKNLTSGSGGNISYRLGDRIYISATGSYFGKIQLDDFSCVSLAGEVLQGRKPSKEVLMHLECYRRREDITSIIHLHPVYTIAVTCMKEGSSANEPPVFTPGYGMRIGEIPTVPYYMPGSEKLAMVVADVIEHRNSVLLRNHGLLTVGKTLWEAFGLAEEIEENAHVSLLVGDRGTPITKEQIEELQMLGGSK